MYNYYLYIYIYYYDILSTYYIITYCVKKSFCKTRRDVSLIILLLLIHYIIMT